MGWAAVFVGGGIGSVLRLAISRWALLGWGPGFPWGTLLVNTLGCLLIGVAAARLSSMEAGHAVRLFLITGVLGGFTTFSAFGLETYGLWQRGAVGAALGYAAASLLLCLGAVPLGIAIARH